MAISRRTFTGSALAILAVAASSPCRPVRADAGVEDVRQLKPGQFVWYPERAEAGPVAIVVSLPDQLVYVYRNGIRIGVSTCATGRPGHVTPTGVFTILQKDKTHHSSLYNDASMPFTERLTWSGVALHAGNLPGYPDSHGCVHLPLAFSELLFEVTQLGTPVIIADDATAPTQVLHPGLLWNEAIERDIQSVEAGAASGAQATPAAGSQATPPAGPLSILISGPNRELFALQDGVEVVTSPVTITDPDQPLGTHVFVFADQSGGQERWHAVSVGKPVPAAGGDGDAATAALERVQIPTQVSGTLQPLLHPGATMMITDLPATADTRSGKDFVILAQVQA
ncbi:MAG: L,D-transpeptidase [Geminicoccaceae bacterium]